MSFTIQLDLYWGVVAVAALLLTLVFGLYVLRSIDDRKPHNAILLSYAVSYLMVVIVIVDILAMIVVLVRPSKSIEDFLNKGSAIRNDLPGMIEEYGYTVKWNVSDLVKAERRLSGLCLECGIGEHDNRQGGHHQFCRIHNDPHAYK